MTKHSGNTQSTSSTPTKTTSSEESSKGTLGDGKSQIKKQGEVYKGKKNSKTREIVLVERGR